MVTTAPQPTADPALEGLPRANVRQAGDFPEDEFVLIPNVPVFAEHATTAKDGRPLEFGMHELQLVANRCNQRISESGDYAAICFGHTPAPDENKPMPAVCGYAGPFRIGTHGASNRTAILADFHVYRDDLAEFKRHPRRSPEVWLEDRYEEMFLDPIAVLSSETPRLDLGLLYSAQKAGRIVEKYTAVAPAAGNAFVPNMGPETFAAPSSAGDPAMLNTDDVRMIIEAIEKQDWVVATKQLLASQEGPNTSMPGMAEMPMAPASPPPAAPGAEMPPLAPEAAGGEMMPPEAPPAMPADPPMGPPPMDNGPEPPAAPMEEEEPKKMSANEQGPYQDGTESEIASGEKVEHDLGSPRDPAKYACKDGKDYDYYDDMDDDDFEDYARQRASRRKKNYEAGGSVESDNVEQPGNASVEPDNPGPSGEGSAGNDSGEATGEYQESGGVEVVKFARQQADNQALRKEVAALRGKIDSEQQKRTDAERYSALAQHSQRYNLDAEHEMKCCRYGKMNDEQFGEHLARIQSSYERRPIADFHRLPTHTEGSTAAAAQAPERPGNNRAREAYSKDASDKALKVATARAARGQDGNYPQVLSAIKDGTYTKTDAIVGEYPAE